MNADLSYAYGAGTLATILSLRCGLQKLITNHELVIKNICKFERKN